MGSVAEDTAERIVVLDPVLDLDDAEVGGRIADDDSLDPRVDDLALAHHAGGGSGNQLSALGVHAHHVKRCAQHLLTGGGDDGVGLGVQRAAKLVSLTARNAQRLAHTGADVVAILASARSSVVAGGDDGIVLDDDGTVVLAQAGRSLRDGLGNIQIVVMF